jgi:hypothetical protein
MNYTDLFIGILIIAIPLLLLVLCYRKSICKNCDNKMKNITDKFINNLNKLGSKIPDKIERKEDFFNFSDLFSGKVNKEDPVSLSLESLGPAPLGPAPLDPVALELDQELISDNSKKDHTQRGSSGETLTDLISIKSPMSTNIKKSYHFPPLENDDSDSDPDPLFFEKTPFLEKALSKSIEIDPKHNHLKKNNIYNNNPSFPDLGKVKDPKIDSTKLDPIELDSSNVNLPYIKSVDHDLFDKNKQKEPNMKDIFKNSQCNFYNNKCPDDYMELGNFSLDGTSLKCGNIENTKPAKAMAHIKNNNLYEIVILDKGQGYSLNNPPKVRIHSRNEEKGFGANANALVNKDGTLKSIQIINPGYNYTETPNVLIDPPYMNSSCHLCCNFN